MMPILSEEQKSELMTDLFIGGASYVRLTLTPTGLVGTRIAPETFIITEPEEDDSHAHT